MAKKNTNRLLFILVGLAVVMIIVAIVGKQQGWIGQGKKTEVELAIVKFGNITEKVSASGKVQPEIEIKISPEVSGEIIELKIKEGDSVTKGEHLLRIRPDNYIFAVDQAEANASNAQARLAQSEAALSQSKARFYQAEQNYKRSKELFAQKVISDAEYEQAEADYKVAKENLKADEKNVEANKYTLANANAGVKNARENLRLTEIKAPENGIISKLGIEKGERVVGTSQMMGTELLRMADLNKMEVRVDVNENDIIRISLGDTAEIEVDAYSAKGEKFKGLVTLIANSPTEDNLSSDAITEFEVRIKILPSSYQHLVSDDNPYPFKPGMTASVDIITDTKNGILTVPLTAVTTRSEQSEDEEEKRGRRGKRSSDDKEKENKQEEEEEAEVVFLYNQEEESVEMVKVKTGVSDFNNIEILDGLDEEAKIVSGPYLAVSKQLEDGDQVKIEEGDKNEKRKAKRGRRK